RIKSRLIAIKSRFTTLKCPFAEFFSEKRIFFLHFAVKTSNSELLKYAIIPFIPNPDKNRHGEKRTICLRNEQKFNEKYFQV
ncbi:MAG: hypothetical protein IJ759_05855, partial [Bacteroidales bacterium]|nr:hypothetical protein [Bacteroidales bacterium]